MPVQPTGTDQTNVFTTSALVQRYIPVGAITSGSPASGKVTSADLTDIIARRSKYVGNILASKGFAYPFVDISHTNPSPPEAVISIVTDFVVADCRAILRHGNRKSGATNYYLNKAKDDLKHLLENPMTIGYGKISTPEPLTLVAGDLTNQYGKLTANYYRLANRNLRLDSLRFVKSDGTEAFRTDGLPFDYGRDWQVVDYAESVILILNESMVLAQIGSGGGVVYECSWRNLKYGQAHPQPITGVSRL